MAFTPPFRTLAALALAAPLAFWPASGQAQQITGAIASLRDASGAQVGFATFTDGADGVRLTVTVRGLQPGRHGIHLHAVARCEGPAFTSAGGHINLTSTTHGLLHSDGGHTGDLPELVVDADGTALYATVTNRVTVADGPRSLIDADGSAIVIHADPDDQATDPAGNSGTRIVCGTIDASSAASWLNLLLPTARGWLSVRP